MMTSIRYFPIAAFFIAISNAFAQNIDLNEIKKQVKAFMASTHVSGVALSLVQGSKHQELYFGNTGRADKSPVSPQTVFEIGSISKVLTPHLMLVAQEESKLSIHDPVSKHIPALRSNSVFDQITLKDLATHTSSLPSIWEAPKNLKSKQEVIEWLQKWKPSSPPKSQYSYSNVGIALIGFVLEEIYHQDWDQLLITKVLSPRKMKSTFQKPTAENKTRIAQGFDSHQKPTELLPESWPFYPAAALKTTASDLGDYLASWNDEYFGYLKESVCFSNHSCQGLGIEAHPLSELSKSFVNVQFTTSKGSDPSVKKEEKLLPLNQIFIDKTGSSDGMSAYIAMIPRSGVGVVILCNQWNVEERIGLARRILDILNKAHPNRVR